MEQGTNRGTVIPFLQRCKAVLRELARGRQWWTPTVPAFRALWRRVPWGKLLLSLGFVVQAWLVVLVWQLVELTIDLFEVWALLARHSLGL
jgi:hypothetical protein